MDARITFRIERKTVIIFFQGEGLSILLAQTLSPPPPPPQERYQNWGCTSKGDRGEGVVAGWERAEMAV